MSTGNIPAGQIVVHKADGEIIFRVGEGVQIGSRVHLRCPELTCGFVVVEVGSILQTLAGKCTCSTKERKPLTAAQVVPTAQPYRRGKTQCTFCNHWYYVEETCPYCKDE